MCVMGYMNKYGYIMAFGFENNAALCVYIREKHDNVFERFYGNLAYEQL